MDPEKELLRLENAQMRVVLEAWNVTEMAAFDPARPEVLTVYRAPWERLQRATAAILGLSQVPK